MQNTSTPNLRPLRSPQLLPLMKEGSSGPWQRTSAPRRGREGAESHSPPFVSHAPLVTKNLQV